MVVTPRRSDDIVRYVMVGAGFISNAHIPAVLNDPRSQLVAIVDKVLPKAQAQAARYGVQHAFATIEEAFDLDRVDCFLLGTPPTDTPSLALRLIEQGFHVFCEKPVAMSTEVVASVRDAALRRGVIAAPGFSQLFYPGVARARELVADGAIGSPFFVRSLLTKGRGWDRRPASTEATRLGELIDSGIHRLYTLSAFTGKIARVWGAISTQRNVANDRGENFVLVHLESETGVMASLQITTIPGVWDNRTEIHGETGIVVINGGEQNYFIHQPPLVVHRSADYSVPYVVPNWRTTFEDQLRHLTTTILGEGQLLVTMDAAVEVWRVFDAIYESAAHGGRSVTVGP